jgi:large subunit ribosomal protein L9
MATNQVLLLQPVEGLGAEGDTVTVRSGYARNFLLPTKIAVPVTQANKKQMEALLKAREAREQKELESARELSTRIEGVSYCHRSQDWRGR